jgi:glycine/D-amino acid oxidase-like deaminating enzyme
VVVVGGGFGGLHTARALRAAPVQVTLIDRNNYHLFQPLTYQVATGSLSSHEIGKPLRAIFRGDPNVRVLLAGHRSVDRARGGRARIRRSGAGELAGRPPDLPDRLREPGTVLVRWGYNSLTHGRPARRIIRAPKPAGDGGGTSRPPIGACERAND